MMLIVPTSSHFSSLHLYILQYIILLILLLRVLPAYSSSAGETGCPCLPKKLNFKSYPVLGDCLQFTPDPEKGDVYCYPLDYGFKCKAHDRKLSPFCRDSDGSASSTQPNWCLDSWCFVDPDNCDLLKTQSSYFEQDNAYISYATCGTASSFEKYEGGDAEDLRGLVYDVETYLMSIRRTLEDEIYYHSLNEGKGHSDAKCSMQDSCNCRDCEYNTDWGASLDTSSSALTLSESIKTTAKDIKQLKCFGQVVTEEFNRIGSKEYTDPSSVGYLVYGDQRSGGLVQWPSIDWCPSEYDPRLRPWFAIGSGGPKDIVIVIDLSNSMVFEGRLELAKDAVKAVLKTLTEYDYGNIVWFGSEAGAYSSLNVQMTEETIHNMTNWVDNNFIPRGSTNFEAGLNMARDLLVDSENAGRTSSCKKAILFMTDGEDSTWNNDKMDALITWRRFTGNPVIFTYSLGADASFDVPKQIACASDGIFYKVEDGGNLNDIMAGYYHYFSAGADSCIARWITYADAATGQQLLDACLPAYDRTTRHPTLLGVVCMSVNIIVKLSELENHPQFSNFQSKYKTSSATCSKSLHMSSCFLELMRERSAGSYSMCEKYTQKGSDLVNSLSAQCDQQFPTPSETCTGAQYDPIAELLAFLRTLWTALPIGVIFLVILLYLGGRKIYIKLYLSGTLHKVVGKDMNEGGEVVMGAVHPDVIEERMRENERRKSEEETANVFIDESPSKSPQLELPGIALPVSGQGESYELEIPNTYSRQQLEEREKNPFLDSGSGQVKAENMEEEEDESNQEDSVFI